MRKFTTQLLTEETKSEVAMFENVVDFANREEELYLAAMTRAGVDFVRRDSLVVSFNESVMSYAFHYGK
jgi:hypothetical protein